MRNILYILLLLPILSFSQGQQNDKYYNSSTGTNSYTVTINAITAPSPYDGQKIWVKFVNANSGASSLVVVSGNGTYPVKDIETFSGAALTSGIIPANSQWQLEYNSSFNSWQIVGSVSAITSAWGLTGNSGLSGTTNFIGNTDNIPFNIRVNNVRSGRIENTGANTFLGYSSGASNVSGNSNTALGYGAMGANTSGSLNTAIGANSGSAMSGTGNTVVGYNSFVLGASGADNNTALGVNSLGSNTSGDNNVAIGRSSLFSNVSGSNNIAIGNEAGFYETGSNKIMFDNRTRSNEADARIKMPIYIETGTTVATQSVTINGQFRLNDGTGATGRVLTYKADGFSEWAVSSAGTVTSFTVATANGVSAVVTNPTTTPVATYSLGAITPTSVNGNTIATGTGTLNLNNFSLQAVANNTVDNSNNLSGGVAGSVPYQIGINTTGMLAPGSIGQAFISGGVGAPTWATIEKVLEDFYTDVSNTSTTETDLYTYTTAANTLANNGDKLIINTTGTHTANGNTKTLKAYFGGTQIGNFAFTSPGQQWQLDGFVIRVSSTVVRCMVRITSSSEADQVTQYTEVTGLTLSNTNIIKITGQSSAASSDITAKAGFIEFKPAAL